MKDKDLVIQTMTDVHEAFNVLHGICLRDAATLTELASARALLESATAKVMNLEAHAKGVKDPVQG